MPSASRVAVYGEPCPEHYPSHAKGCLLRGEQSGDLQEWIHLDDRFVAQRGRNGVAKLGELEARNRL